MALRSMSTTALRRELARRERGASRLISLRNKLQGKLDAIFAELSDLGIDGTARRGRPPGRRGPGRPRGAGRRGRKPGRGPGRPKGSGRARNKLSLADAVTKVVAVGRTVSPADVLAKVKKVYKSSSANLGMMVANTLAKHPEFKRLGRGQYLRKGGKSAGPRRAGKGGRKAKAGRRPKARGKARGGRRAHKARRRAGRRTGRKAGRKSGRSAASSGRSSRRGASRTTPRSAARQPIATVPAARPASRVLAPVASEAGSA